MTSEADPCERERRETIADAVEQLLGANLIDAAAARLKTFSHHQAVFCDARLIQRTAVVLHLARACEARPGDSELAEWRRLITRNAHRLARGGPAALLQLALDAGPQLAPGRAVSRWVERNPTQGTWLRRIDAAAVEPDDTELVLEGHVGMVFSVAWLPNGREALTCGSDGALRLWDTDTGLRRWSFETQAHKPLLERRLVRSLAVAPSGRRAAAGDEGGEVSVWDLDSGALLFRGQAHPKAVNSMAFTPDGSHIVSCCTTRSPDEVALALWDVRTGALAGSVKRADGMASLVVSSDGASVITAEYRHGVERWALDGLAPLGRVEGCPARAHLLLSARDGGRLVVGGRDSVAVLDAATLQPVFEPLAQEPIGDLMAVVPGKDRILSARGGDVHVIDLATGGTLNTVHGQGGRATAVAVHPEGRSLLWATEEGTVRRRPMESPRARIERPHGERVVAVAFDAPRGRVLSVSDEGSIVAWDPRRGEAVSRLAERGDPVQSAVMDARCRRLAVARGDGLVVLWDLVTDAKVATVDTRIYGPDHVALSPGGDILAVGGGHVLEDAPGLPVRATSRIYLFRTGDSARLGALEGHDDDITGLAFLSRSTLVSVGQDGDLRVWDVEGGGARRGFRVHPDLALAVLSDERTALTGSSTLRRWDVFTGALDWASVSVADPIVAIRVAPDGRHGITLGQGRTLGIWDLARGVCTVRFEADVLSRAGALLPDGRIALGDESGRVTFFEQVPL